MDAMWPCLDRGWLVGNAQSQHSQLRHAAGSRKRTTRTKNSAALEAKGKHSPETQQNVRKTGHEAGVVIEQDRLQRVVEAEVATTVDL